MHAFFSWLTSQSGVSLLVALIALGGVLVTTWWNNKAADKRRRDDQAAEDARRKADDDRRERERREQLQREDRARQRKAVADCIREISKAAALVTERVAAVHLNGNGEQGKLVKAIELTRFNIEASNQLTLLDIEVTQPDVSAEIYALWEQIASDYRPLLEARSRGGQAWTDQAEGMPPLSDLALAKIRSLTIVARLSLLEHPEHMANQPVVPLDGDNDK